MENDGTGMRKKNILIVDDEKKFATVLRIFLEKAGFAPTHAGSLAAARSVLAAHRYELVLLDLRLGQDDGLELLQEIHKKAPETVTVIMTGYASLESAQLAIKHNAYDYLMKPFNDMENDLLRVVRRALAHQDLQTKNRMLLEKLKEYYRENEKGLERARKVQRSLIPTEIAAPRDYAFQGKAVFAQQVGGGFYNARAMHNGRTVFYLGDVGGEGLPAALLMVTVTSIIEGLVQCNDDPAEIIHLLSLIMNRHLQGGFRNFVSVCLCSLAPAQRKLSWAAAGSVGVSLIRGGGRVEVLEGNGPFLGDIRRASYRIQQCMIDVGDRLVLYNSAITDATDARKEPYGRERLNQELRGPWQGLGDRVVENQQRFVGEQSHPHDLMLLALLKNS